MTAVAQRHGYVRVSRCLLSTCDAFHPQQRAGKFLKRKWPNIRRQLLQCLLTAQNILEEKGFQVLITRRLFLIWDDIEMSVAPQDTAWTPALSSYLPQLELHTGTTYYTKKEQTSGDANTQSVVSWFSKNTGARNYCTVKLLRCLVPV